MRVFVRTPRALTDRGIESLYKLADRCGVSICPYGGTGSPSRGPAEWVASGSILALIRFVRRVDATPISRPQYPAVHWTDKGRWER